MSRDKIVSVRFSDIEHQRIEAAATRRGCSVSDLLRRLVLDHAAPLRQPPVPAGTSIGSSHVSIIWDGDRNPTTPTTERP